MTRINPVTEEAHLYVKRKSNQDIRQNDGFPKSTEVISRMPDSQVPFWEKDGWQCRRITETVQELLDTDALIHQKLNQAIDKLFEDA